MAASVRIEDEAFVDPRVELLGALAGYNRFEALGRLAHLWRVCTQRETYTLAESFVVACLGEKGPDALVTAGLGERVPDGIRVKGTAGRIEWLRVRREAAKTGGKANKERLEARGKPKGSQTGAKRSQSRSTRLSQTGAKGEPEASQTNPNDSPPTASPTPTASPDLPSEEVPPSPPEGGITVVIPPELDAPEFRAAWGEWKAERAAKKHKAYTPRGEADQLKSLAPLGPVVAIDCISDSIRQGYQGLFPEKFKKKAPAALKIHQPNGPPKDIHERQKELEAKVAAAEAARKAGGAG